MRKCLNFLSLQTKFRSTLAYICKTQQTVFETHQYIPGTQVTLFPNTTPYSISNTTLKGFMETQYNNIPNTTLQVDRLQIIAVATCTKYTVMLKRRPCRLQTADCADRADCADWVLFFYLYLNFVVKFYYSFLLPLIMCTVHHHHMLHWCVPARVMGRKWENHGLMFTGRCKSSFACF